VAHAFNKERFTLRQNKNYIESILPIVTIAKKIQINYYNSSAKEDNFRDNRT